LSKDYLQGKSEKDKLYVHPEGWYDEHEVELRLNSVVTGVDRSSHEVSLEGGHGCTTTSCCWRPAPLLGA
jgi:3-phenylpropionate/trans-cinnamate dioxygenase ferredoxin reductase subunit